MNLLLPGKGFLAERLAGYQYIIQNSYLKKLVATPAPPWSLVAISDKRHFAFRFTLGTGQYHHNGIPFIPELLLKTHICQNYNIDSKISPGDIVVFRSENRLKPVSGKRR
jgi:hypothetical protein